MKQHIIYFILAAGMGLFSTHSALSSQDATVTIRVHDVLDKPVGDAVVTLHPAQAAKAPKQRPQAIMVQRDMTFEPHVLAIPKGTEVWFPNEDDFRHHIYSFSQAKQFEVRLYGGDEEKRVTFNTAGIVALGCNIHDSMLAYIYVADTPYVRKSDDTGRVEFLTVSPGDYTVSIWHPRMERRTGSVSQTIKVDDKGAVEKTIAVALKREKKKSRKKRY